MYLSSNIHLGDSTNVRAKDVGDFSTVDLTDQSDGGAAVNIFLHSVKECDKLLAAVEEARAQCNLREYRKHLPHADSGDYREGCLFCEAMHTAALQAAAEVTQ